MATLKNEVDQIQFMRGTEAQIVANGLKDGEPALATDTGRLHYGYGGIIHVTPTQAEMTATAEQATTASTSATQALASATQATTDATNALGIANAADIKADTAISNSESAVTTASAASGLATTASTDATQAKTDSTTALSTANTAKATADQVRSEFDQIVAGNTEAEVINARTNASGTTFTTVKARLDDSDTRLAQTNSTVTSIQTALDLKASQSALQKLVDEGFLNSYASSVDANNHYMVVTFKRSDMTVYLISTLSNPDVSGNYQTCTWNFYDVDGTTIIATRTWTFVYDANGTRVTKEVI